MSDKVMITESFYDVSISEWLVEYRVIVGAYPVLAKTIANRLCLISKLDALFGSKSLLFLKPYEVQLKLKEVASVHPSLAKRLLIELRNVYKEAIIYDKTSKNVASFVKMTKYKVARERLTLAEWLLMQSTAKLRMPYWVTNLLQLALLTAQRRQDLCKMKFSDIQDGFLHVTQGKTGAKIAIPLSLGLPETGLTLGEAILQCVPRNNTGFLLHCNGNKPPCEAYASAAFEHCKELSNITRNVSLHECRSLAERLYSAYGVNTRILLGHTCWRMTDLYHNDRGLSSDAFNYVSPVVNHYRKEGDPTSS